MAQLRTQIPWWLWKDQRRECYENSTQLLPAIPIIAKIHLLKAAPDGLQPDAHENEYELHLIEEGRQEIWVDSPDQRFTVRGGSAMFTKPGQLHSGVRQ